MTLTRQHKALKIVDDKISKEDMETTRLEFKERMNKSYSAVSTEKDGDIITVHFDTIDASVVGLEVMVFGLELGVEDVQWLTITEHIDENTVRLSGSIGTDKSNLNMKVYNAEA